MEIMDLVRWDRRSFEYSESRVSERALATLPASPVFARHVAVVGRGSAPGETVAFIVRTHAMKTVTARKLSFEVVDIR
jgi:hypothetical protein